MKLSKPIWYDKKTFDEKAMAEQYIKTCKEAADTLMKKLGSFYEDARIYERLYQYRSNLDKFTQVSVDNNFDVVENNLLTFNVVRACCNSAHNKISKVRPKVTFLTKDSDMKTIETAKKLDNWIFKLFKKNKIYKKASQAFLDSCIRGVGVLKVYIKKGNPEFEKVPSTDMFFDKAYTGGYIPDVAGEKKVFSAYELREMFPDKAELIFQMHGEAEKIIVYEQYKAYKKKTIYTDKVLLDYSDWNYSLPYVFIKWTEATEGVVGVALSKEVHYLQQTITYILEKVLKGLHLFAIPRVFMEKGSDPTPKDISNLVAEIIEYNKGGEKPTFSTPPVINTQVLDILLMFWEKAFEVTGLSQLQAHGQVPSGLKQASGTALRTYNQIESERFQLIRADYEDLFIEIAKKTIEMSNTFPKGITKSEVTEAQEDMSIFSSNILPETPAGRQAFVSELFSSGLINKTQALTLMNSPDTDRLLSSESDRERAIEIELERAVKKGEMPDPETSSVLGIESYLDKTRKLYAKILIEEGSDSEKLTPLKDLSEELVNRLQQQAKMNALQEEGNSNNTPNKGASNVLSQQPTG